MTDKGVGIVLVIDINNMTINEINNEIWKLENKREYWLREKERLFDKTQPTSIEIKEESIQGGLRTDRFAAYVIECDDKEIEKKLTETQDQINHLTRYVESELERIGQYEPLMKRIVELREVQKMTWRNISEVTHYSETQCRRIYRKYKNERDV